MQHQFPDDWLVYLTMGDIMARCGDYEKAKAYYRQGITIQNAPTFCDSYESIAQVCELQNNIPEAIEVLKEELHIQKTQWNVTTGETADVIHRWIARLEQKLK